MLHIFSTFRSVTFLSFRVPALFAALAFFICFATVHTAQAQFSGTPITVDSAGVVGAFTSQAIVNGNPAISYYDSTNGNLKFVRANDANGTSFGTPVTVDSTGDVGRYTSLEVGNGFLGISYYDVTNGNLKYVRSTDNGVTFFTPVVVDSVGDVGLYTSLTIGNGFLGISYYDATNGNLKFVRSTDTGFTFFAPVVADSTGNVGLYTSIATGNGFLGISYYDFTNGNLKFARSDNNGVTFFPPAVVDFTGDVGFDTSLTIGNGFFLGISYYDFTNGNLKFARSTDTGFSFNTVLVDSTGNVGLYTSTAMVNGNPAISYYDATNGDLKFVQSPDNGVTFFSPITVDSVGFTGQYTSLAVVNGNPAISYYDSTNGDLRFIRANPTPTPTPTPTPQGFESDVAPRSNGDGSILSDDVVQIRRFLNGTNTPSTMPNEFQRADSDPFATKGDGFLNSADIVQTRRYQNGTSPMQTAGGPTMPGSRPEFETEEVDKLTAESKSSADEPRQMRVENMMTSDGETLTVKILVNAVGDEAEYGFTLNYDESLLSKPVIGVGNTTATVRACNTQEVGAISCSVGGFATNNPKSSEAGIGEIGGGDNQLLLRVEFTVRATAPLGETEIKLSKVNAASDAPQLLRVVGTPTNAVVNIPAFTPGTFNPVTVTFTPTNPALPVDFTLRAASTFHAANIRVRCALQ